MKRKEFLQTLVGIPLLASIDHFAQSSGGHKELVANEDFWTKIRKQFYLDDRSLDFRCNATSSLPNVAFDHFVKNYRYIQAYPSSRNREIANGAKEQLRVSLADEINCSISEVAIMRSTTEALNNAIMGFPFQKGDEVIASAHEYDSMLGSLYQQQSRVGITVKQIDIPYKPEASEQIVELFRRNITPRTKMLLISHIVWISGQIYPVKELCALAKKHNIFTVIDAAQTFSHIPVDVRDMDCDYLGGSLHKWAAAPLGTGFLYVKQKNIGKTMPLMGHYNYKADDEAIEKFENLGATTPVFDSAAISLEYWKKLGVKLKTQRTRYLMKLWTERLRSLSDITILTNTDETQSCGITYFQVKNRGAKDVRDLLSKKHDISVQAFQGYKTTFVDLSNLNAVGIATPVFITAKEIERLFSAVKEIVK